MAPCLPLGGWVSQRHSLGHLCPPPGGPSKTCTPPPQISPPSAPPSLPPCFHGQAHAAPSPGSPLSPGPGRLCLPSPSYLHALWCSGTHTCRHRCGWRRDPQNALDVDRGKAGTTPMLSGWEVAGTWLCHPGHLAGCSGTERTSHPPWYGAPTLAEGMLWGWGQQPSHTSAEMERPCKVLANRWGAWGPMSCAPEPRRPPPLPRPGRPPVPCTLSSLPTKLEGSSTQLL